MHNIHSPKDKTTIGEWVVLIAIVAFIIADIIGVLPK
jgi:hypothetical protein